MKLLGNNSKNGDEKGGGIRKGGSEDVKMDGEDEGTDGDEKGGGIRKGGREDVEMDGEDEGTDGDEKGEGIRKGGSEDVEMDGEDEGTEIGKDSNKRRRGGGGTVAKKDPGSYIGMGTKFGLDITNNGGRDPKNAMYAGLGTRTCQSIIMRWNYRGIGQPRAVQVLDELIKTHRPGVIILLEIFANRSIMLVIRVDLKREGCFAVDAAGHSGGFVYFSRRGKM
nr:LLDR protein Lu12-9873 [Linum usitatissimum]